jgi:heme/copper-type cytochrome/quinol oxidase subunit 4
MGSQTARELLWLVALVIAVDALFILGYFLRHLNQASDSAKVGFTVVWTAAVLLIAIRGLSRIRKARLTSTTKGTQS